jgi:hypothetical protein
MALKMMSEQKSSMMDFTIILSLAFSRHRTEQRGHNC